MTNMIPVTYGYARVSKADDQAKNLDTQLLELERYGIRQEHVFSDVASGRSERRSGWQQLMSVVRSGDTIVVAYLDRLSRNFEQGVRLQAELTEENIGIIAIREGIDTSEESASANLYRRMMLAQGAYQVESTGERIRAGQARAKAEGRPPGRPPALTPEKMQIALHMYAEGASIRQIARVVEVAQGTVKKAIASQPSPLSN